MIIMLIGLGILFGGIFVFQSFKSHMMKKYMSAAKEAITVTTIEAKNQNWQPKLKATGSLRAIQGVDVTTEVAGLVKNIEFTPGTQVSAGKLLVKLNDDAEVAQLQVFLAAQEIARVTYERDKAQLAVAAVSQQTVDNDEASLKGAIAQVNQQKAVIDKKIIRAPFSGRLGISNVNPGQYVNPGDKIVTLQSLDPIYVDFYIPQQSLKLVKKGQTVNIISDSYPGKIFNGKITTINPIVDAATRNIQIEATISNPQQMLLPGMFATVEVDTGKPVQYLTLPQTAISFNPYGEIAYIVKQKEKLLIAEQTFVTVGDTRGDQIAVLKGIKAGDIVVTSGQLKLKNGSEIVVNNTVVPTDNPAPKVVDE